MNLQALMSQLQGSTNPLQMMMGMLTGNQKQMANQFQNKPIQEQAEAIARMCNDKGITKEQLTQIINMLNSKK